jgi:L-lactate utilization protein LutB
MFRMTAFAAASFGLAWLSWQAPGTALAQDKVHHPHLHHALRELREARTELKESSHDYGGHREKALKATDAAINQIDKALKGAGDNIKGAGKFDKDIYKKYEHHPHMHHALHELREAHTELKEAKHDFGGHREKALHDVHHAIEQIELALKHHKG